MKSKSFRLLSLFTIIVLVIVFLPPSLSTHAASPSKLIVKKVKSTPSSIQIAWDGHANHYEILQGQAQIYSGKAHSYKWTNLASHMQYDLQVVAYNSNDEVTGKSVIHALTTKGKKSSTSTYIFDSKGKLSLSAGENGGILVKHGEKVDSGKVQNAQPINPLRSVRVNSIVNSNSIVLDWNPIVGVKKYTVSRNGVQIATVNDSSFTDFNVPLC